MQLSAESPSLISKAKEDGMIKVTLIKSTIGEVESVKATVKALGLTKIRSAKTFEDSPALQGQIKKVAHLIKVENV